jgi:hypothetical protein
MKGFFTREFRLTFAGAICGRLREPKSIQYHPAQQVYHRALSNPAPIVVIKGTLPLYQHGEMGETTVGITLTILSDWMQSPPIVATDAPFLRAERDWHVPLKPYICHELDREWKWKLDELWESSTDSNAIIAVSSSWCIRNVDSLITRHLHGHRYGIVKWPKQWGQWSHGDDGVREFVAFTRKLEAA